MASLAILLVMPSGSIKTWRMTNNVLAAAEIVGIKKIVCGSSLAVYGLYYPSTELAAGLLAG